MARPLPVNLIFAGTGAILLVSGLQGKRIADVLKGDFGKLDLKNPSVGSAKSEQEQQQSAAFLGEGAGTQTVASSATFAPSPTSLSRRPSGPSAPNPHNIPVHPAPPGGAPEQESFLRREEEAGGAILP